MTQVGNPFAPLQDSDRIQSLDVMRGIVLFGILIMNINGMGLAGAYMDPTVSGGATGWDLVTWITSSLLFEGTMRALFSLLFGVGVFILLDRLEKKGAGMEGANIYFRRIIWLLVFGLIHGYLILWSGDILYNYALFGFIVFPFRTLSPKKLMLIFVFLIAVGTLWDYLDYRKDVKFMDQLELARSNEMAGKDLTKEETAALKKWDDIQEQRSPEAIKEYNESMRQSYFKVVVFNAPHFTEDNEKFPYRYDLWDVLSMMLLGIALFKLNILSAEKSYKFYALMAIIGYAVGLSINYYELKTVLDSDFSYLGFSQSFATYQLGRVPVAIGHIGLIMLFCKLPMIHWLKKSLAAVGKMALTNYIMHSVFALFIFTGAGFAMFGKLQRHELMYIVFGIWIFQLIVSPIWLKYYRFGPLEWLWRNLSYLKVHNLKKNSKE
ncbi:DUF418 domain-containing protein [Gaetbulibacter aestuarii]|uniref:DUF418 domain-containing protein n=1 Tax=Gaetbulibacter aestuarii TaxID=1502358 RepID=A0ABW7MZ97_9FLAO